MIFLNGKIFFTDKLSNKIDKKNTSPTSDYENAIIKTSFLIS